jgi:hypothetical protein
LGSSLAFMDGSIVNVALPTLQRPSILVRHRCSGSCKATHSSLPHFSCSVELLATNLAERRSSCWAWRFSRHLLLAVPLRTLYRS